MVILASAIAANVRAIIKRQGLKQYAVAERAGYSARAFNAMLNGRKIITDNDICPIAKALGVTPNDLFKSA